MIHEQNLVLIRRLLEKTRSNEAEWTEPNDLLASLYMGFVRLDLARASVSIGRLRSGAIQFRVYNSEGSAIIDEFASPNQEGYDELTAILDLSLRKSRRIDETLKEIDEFLRSRGKK